VLTFPADGGLLLLHLSVTVRFGRGVPITRAALGGVILLAALATSCAVAAPASARAAMPAPEMCKGEGWQTVGTVDQQLFRSIGACVSYSAQGGTLVPLLQAIADERCIIGPIDPPNAACFTVTGFRLEPGSQVVVTLIAEGEPLVFFATVDALGQVFFQTAAVCVPGTLEIVLTISASGVTATGIPLVTPTDTFSIFCTRV
jgi:hypothetical protein